MSNRIVGHFRDSAELKIQAASALAQPISQAVELIFMALSNGNKILACGNGTAAAHAQYFAAALVDRFERERLPMPALALGADAVVLSSIGNGAGVSEIYSKQVQAFGQPGDVLLVITGGGDIAGLSAAVDTALEREMRVVALTGKEGSAIGKQISDADVHINVPHERAARVLEVHLLTIHCLCDGIDVALFGGDTDD
ncbi:D-sedoheptulose 7-phosphate isomerase [Paucimonas lemoignei]|uniref:D-sedoheptulose 7-phosphate isomerase n=1 Tax=Paucimonas lemoignei TaxID=29443 RepID=A0A4R3HZZ5_PAULE|nr:SIS domain-containing protein [Paucimonas lemoignei]TCS37865.1 D-sedoheptulose 7-phosphate isomerase [Paucimonas lemoignei]